MSYRIYFHFPSYDKNFFSFLLKDLHIFLEETTLREEKRERERVNIGCSLPIKSTEKYRRKHFFPFKEEEKRPMICHSPHSILNYIQ